LIAAGIEDLREKREQIMKQIQDEEMEKQRVQQELAALTQRLSRVNESLARKVGAASMLVAQSAVAPQLNCGSIHERHGYNQSVAAAVFVDYALCAFCAQQASEALGHQAVRSPPCHGSGSGAAVRHKTVSAHLNVIKCSK
jgi:hypothetical protein